ncbi:MAG: hypothetical protein ACJAS4_000172 [Bacteriovoracaceae bacterium]|jgi:hypothetical protein
MNYSKINNILFLLLILIFPSEAILSSHFEFKFNGLLLESTTESAQLGSNSKLKVKIVEVLKEDIENFKTKNGDSLKLGNEIKISLYEKNIENFPVNNKYTFSLTYSDYDYDDGEISVDENWKIQKILKIKK